MKIILLIHVSDTVALQLDRAQFLQLGGGGAWWLSSSESSSSLSSPKSSFVVDDPCQNGAIMPEQAVTGAYSQVCMTLPERQFTLNNGQRIVIRQKTSESGRTGMAVWNSGLLLVRLLQAILPTLKGDEQKSILELGCGTGLVGVAAAKLGAKSVLVTDGNPDIVELARSNIELNQCQDQVQAQTLQWGILDAMDYSDMADLVLGSDLTYNSGTWRVLAETMVTVVKPDGYVLYLSCGHEGFNVNAELDGFLSVAKEVGLVQVDDIFGRSNATNDLLLSLLTASEEKQLQSSGGVRMVLLKRKQLVKKS